MTCPFPGMDPYLESDPLWPEFHHLLLTGIYQMLLPALGDRFRTRLQQRQYTVEQALFTSVIREDHLEEYLEVRHRHESRLVTLVEVVSPANRTTALGRQTYLTQRHDAQAAGANLIEIDLVLQGKPTLEYSRENLAPGGYVISVARAAHLDKLEIYNTSLQKRLPRFRLPLTGEDRDSVLDLQAVFTRAFEQGRFASRIDYQRDPPTTLSEDDRQWLDNWLRQMKLR